MATSRQRVAISALALSAAALVARVTHEGYSDTAIIPTKDDVPTLGFGNTTRADGSKVQMGDRTDPVKALQRTMLYEEKSADAIRRCVKVPLHQVEFDIYSDFAYQYGAGALCKSSITTALNDGRYADACKALLQYRFAAGYDCSTPGNKRCWGVWERQKTRFEKCMAVQ